MTIQELYIFACKNNLLEEDIYSVINKYNKLNTSVDTSSSLNSSNIDDDINILLGMVFNKLEWSTTDVIELFST